MASCLCGSPTAVSGSGHVQFPLLPEPWLIVATDYWLERETYRFDGPSTFDDSGPVPHFFEQRYRAAAPWIRVTAQYDFLGGRARSSVAFAPEVGATGSDIDTFLMPSGDVVTSGTRGDVRWRGIALRQDLDLAAWRGWHFGVTLGYQRSRSEFLPADIVVTHTQPPSETRTFTTTRETTWSRRLESGVGIRRQMMSPRETWHVEAEVALLPMTRARLDVDLPDKFPGQRLAYETMAFGLRTRVSVERRWTRYGVGVEGGYGGGWDYRSAGLYSRRAGGIAGYVTLNR